MRVYVLGDIRVGTGGNPALIRNDRQQRILIALLLAGAGGLGVDQIATKVWDEADEPPDAVRTLRTYVNRLRSAVGANGDKLIVTRPGGYALDVAQSEVDSHEFESLSLEASGELDPHVALELYDHALSLWDGAAYGDMAHLDWVRPEAVRLEELRLAAEEARLHLRLDAGRHADVAADAERLILGNPYREQLMAIRATALYRSGRQVDALRELEQHRSRLGEDLGVDPTPELQELEVKILSNDSDLTATGTGPRNLKGYRLGKQIGEGAYSIVYRATQPSVGREVAVKVIRRELANDRTFIQRFEAEAQLVARLQHPRIVPLYDFWREADRAFLVMPWLQGGSLASQLRNGPLSLEETVRIVSHVASGLDFAHSRGVIHRDVKPSNVLMDGGGNTYVSDFGIALSEASADEHLSLISSRSPAYVAPEQFVDSQVGPASDVYALAILTYEMLTGTLPWPELTLSTTYQHQRSGLPPLQLADRRWEAAINAILSDAASPEPERRPPSASDFAEELAGIISEVPARPVSPLAMNPYRGLAAFEEADAPLFFGREDLIAEVVDKLDSEPLALLVGPSGSGKSSVLRAGVIPAMRSKGCFPVVFIPSDDPMASLATALGSVSTIPIRSIRADLENGSPLRDIAQQIVPGAQLVVAVDQMEELFTLNDRESAEQFLAVLSNAVTTPGEAVRVVAAVRADFFDRPLASPSLGQFAGAATVTIGPMRPDQIAAAISKPARLGGVSIEEALVAELAAETAGRSGTLPLMQFALMRAWEERSGDAITFADYERLGGLSGTLVRSAETTYKSLGLADQEVARRLLPRLVQVGDEITRRREEVGAAVGMSGVEPDLIETFVGARLVTVDRDQATREPTIELSHEALIDAWPRLARWVGDSKTALLTAQRLRADSTAWDAEGRPPDLLYGGSRLVAAQEAVADPAVALSSREQEFLEASSAAQGAAEEASLEALIQEERQRGRRRLLGVLAAIAVFIGAGAILMAVMAQRKALEESTAADFVQLISRAIDLQTTQNDLALLLAAEAYAQDPGLASQGALLGTLQNVEGTVEVWEAPRFPRASSFGECYSILGPGQFVVRPNEFLNNRPDEGGVIVDIDVVERKVHRVDASPLECNVHRSPASDDSNDGLYVGSNTNGETLVVASTGEVVGIFSGLVQPFFDGSGRLLAKSGEGEEAGVYVELDPLTGSVLNDRAFEAEMAALTTGGRFISVIFESKSEPVPDSSALLDPETYEVVVDLSNETGRAVAGRSSADDSRFGYVSRDDRLLVWDTAAGQLVVDEPVSASVDAITISPDGSLIALLLEDSSIQIHSGDDGQLVQAIELDREPVMAIDWALDSRIAVLRSSGVVDIVALDGGGLYETGPACCERNEIGVMIGDGIPNPFAVYADTVTGINRYVDVVTGEEWQVDLSPWVLEDPDIGMLISRDKTTTLIRAPFEIFRVDLDGNAEEPRYPFGDNFVLHDDIPDIARANLHGGDEHVFLKLTAGSVSPDWRDVVLEELQIGVIDIDTLEVTVPPNLIDLRGEEPKVINADLLHGGLLVVGQELGDGRMRQQYFTPDGALVLEIHLPETVGWWVPTPDRRYILTADRATDAIQRWDVETGESTTLAVIGEPQPPDMLTDGRFMIQSRSGEYELWDIEGPAKIGVLADVGPRVFNVPEVEPDESHVWLRLDGAWTRIPLNPERWLELACEFAGRKLTAAEWRDFVPGGRPYRDACAN